ncbi:hypothetical protein B0T16DRAFT_84742 [Cercophora newfieldiana]|uniref:Uncharacterized protein n=1 Tax=Cercophora newfieldiana TaxID=92897 RepID=A0AA39YHN7_9PEZI|nr:hypothetical protein B0T16DRAFT_84742 [Cercophora newfieldiana]
MPISQSQHNPVRSKMPPKPRDFYTTEYSGKDFGWFSPSASSATRSPRHRTGPKSRSSSVARSITHKPPSVRKSSTMFGVSKRPRRTKMASIVEESSPDVYMTPAIVTATPTQPQDPESKRPGPWSEWYETRDQTRFWRARKLPDDTWSYEFSDINPSAITKPTRPKPPPGSNRSLASFFFGIPITTPSATSPAAHIRPTAVFPPPPRDPDPESASTTNSSSTSTPSHDRPNIPLARSSGTTFPSSVSTGKGKGSSLSILSSERISVLSKHEETSSRGGRTANHHHRGSKGISKAPALSSKAGAKSKANTPLITTITASPGGSNTKPPKGAATTGGGGKSRAAATTIISFSLPKPRVKAAGVPPAALSGNANVKENTKRLDKKIKNDKELRIDTKKRVKGWLKDVVPEVMQSEWDEQGLPVYK